jgi:hypothetical protein
LYVRVKRELAARDWTSVQQYDDAKTAGDRIVITGRAFPHRMSRRGHYGLPLLLWGEPAAGGRIR